MTYERRSRPLRVGTIKVYGLLGGVKIGHKIGEKTFRLLPYD